MPKSTQGAITLTHDELAANLAGRDPAEIATLEWFRVHCIDRGFGWEAAGKRLHKPSGSTYSRDSVYQAMTGARGHEVSLTPLCEAIERYRRNVESPVPEEGFIPTRLYSVIKTQVERARRQQALTFIVGANACGKTTTIHQIERESGGHVTTVRARDGHRGTLLRDLARRRGLGDRQTVNDLSDRIIAEFAPGDVLIVDEAEMIFGARSSRHTTNTFSFLRTIFDEARCGIVFVLDPSGYKQFQSVTPGDPLRKIYSRRIAPLFLPPFYPEDLELFARRYDLPSAPDKAITVEFETASGKRIQHSDSPRRLQNEICSSHKEGLFVWLRLLQDAAELAQNDSRKISWGAVLKAHALFTAMESEVAA